MPAREDTKEERHSCPYCDEEIIKASLPFCQACGVATLHCPACHRPVAWENKVCPHCGAKVRP